VAGVPFPFSIVQAGGAALNYKHKELLTTMRRYCSNAFTDAPKQDAMNLFLGTLPLPVYIPFSCSRDRLQHCAI
jgi:hypothetical protein